MRNAARDEGKPEEDRERTRETEKDGESKRGLTGRRQREKRLRFQIKSGLISNQDPFPYFQKLAQLLDQDKPVDSSVYTLSKLEVNLTFPNYKTIPKPDPRRFAYKLRDLFGTGFKVTLPLNYPVLPSEPHP
ncbi:hypothetical protein G5I_14364 [Acromyrmex echinatior]|uniref:Uncharacterized protein n=1 Tax=Acromyrmex echinatior TaxID=103372 RepID=F4X7I5_ACREC|nr:hypothetical protein G5I_14364 [Acromyrmex echinatior]